MTILVTGASGFIGRNLAERLSASEELLAVTLAGSAEVPTSTSRVGWVRWDITHPPAPGLLPGRLDAVVHLAQSRSYRSFPERAAEIARVNLVGLANVLEAARAAGARRFVYASSGGVYPAGPGSRSESDPTAPPNFYLATKLAGEHLARAYRDYLDVTCLRLFFVYGLGQARSMFLPDIVRRVIAGEPIQLYGVSGLKANPIHVSDAARSFERALALEGSHLLNVAGPEVLTLRAMAERIGDLLRRPPVLEVVGPAGSRDLVADTQLMSRLLGEPRARFDDNIGEVCDEVAKSVAAGDVT